MKASIPRIACPVCGSTAIVYSCTPSCCFNHVCEDCRSTFELETRSLGSRVAGLEPPDRLLDSCDPTAECARCHKTTVYQAGDQFACLSCSALLELNITEVSPA